MVPYFNADFFDNCSTKCSNKFQQKQSENGKKLQRQWIFMARMKKKHFTLELNGNWSQWVALVNFAKSLIRNVCMRMLNMPFWWSLDYVRRYKIDIKWISCINFVVAFAFFCIAIWFWFWTAPNVFRRVRGVARALVIKKSTQNRQIQNIYMTNVWPFEVIMPFCIYHS